MAFLESRLGADHRRIAWASRVPGYECQVTDARPYLAVAYRSAGVVEEMLFEGAVVGVCSARAGDGDSFEEVDEGGCGGDG